MYGFPKLHIYEILIHFFIWNVIRIGWIGFAICAMHVDISAKNEASKTPESAWYAATLWLIANFRVDMRGRDQFIRILY